MIYVRTTMAIPGAGEAVHVAELEEITAQTCRLHRLVVVQDTPTVAEIPQPIVPHPDTYDAYPDVRTESLTAAQFQALWAEATAQ